jgi:LysR family hydrogen peroxide-inducible transcriptional activator
VGATLLPTLAVKPPVPLSPEIALLPFEGDAPHRRIAMVWRRSAASADFLMRLAEQFRRLPPELLDPSSAVPARTTTGRVPTAASKRRA